MVQAAPGFEPGERGWQANTLSPAPPGDNFVINRGENMEVG